jgi:hypothetical protein
MEWKKHTFVLNSEQKIALGVFFENPLFPASLSISALAGCVLG